MESTLENIQADLEAISTYHFTLEDLLTLASLALSPLRPPTIQPNGPRVVGPYFFKSAGSVVS